MFSSPFIKRKGWQDYATILPIDDKALAKQPRPRDKQREDSRHSVTSSSTAGSQSSVRSAQLESVVACGAHVVESPVEVHQVDDNDAHATLTKHPAHVSMETVTSCFDDILKNCDEDNSVDRRKCECPNEVEITCIDHENEINNKHNASNCNTCTEQDNNRNSIHSCGRDSNRLSGSSVGSVRSADDKTLTKTSQQQCTDNSQSVNKVVECDSQTPKIESFVCGKTIESEVSKGGPPACDSPDLGVDDTSPTGECVQAMVLFVGLG